MVGFVDTLVEVNETDGQATLNVSITRPLPTPGIAGLGIMFALRVDSMDGSAGRGGFPQCCDFFYEFVFRYVTLLPDPLSLTPFW